MALQHLRSSTAHKRPIPTVMSAGQIAVNTNEASPGLFFKDSNGDLVKVGPVHIGTDAPNSSPASVDATALVTGTVYQILTVGTSDFTLVGASANTVGTIFTATGATTGTGTVSGQQGVEKGEQWLDTTGGTYVLKIYDGSAWRSESGTFVDSAGDTMTGALLLDNAASAAAPDLSFDGDADTGIYSPAADEFAIATGGNGRVFIDSSGRLGVGIGNTNPRARLDVQAGADSTVATIGEPLSFGQTQSDTTIHLTGNHNDGSGPSITFSEQNVTSTASTGRGARISSIRQSRASSRAMDLAIKPADDLGVADNGIRVGYNLLRFYTLNDERARLDSSGRLLLGTSSARTNIDAGTGLIGPHVQVEGTNASESSLSVIRNTASATTYPRIYLGKTRGGSLGANTIVQNEDGLGELLFIGADGTNLIEAASIKAEVDGTPGANDMPGRLVFSVTADGESSPTERMRITSGGDIGIGGKITGPGNYANTGIGLGNDGYILASRDSQTGLYVERKTNDGRLVDFAQDAVVEGTISVSGSTVSYNGAHLSRWSQLPGGAERTEILRGSVLSNIDEMCEWEDEDNEQLNRMRVSDVEGDRNVSGVFQAWDDDDDTYTNDFYCAMTGDFVIRIAQGTTVARGDLLMSAGDGTAKPQDDDIVRSKTIAKVTSTTVSTTYADGSYCVPCVLMAC